MMNRRSASSFAEDNQAALSHRLQVVDFAIQDTVLYLDAYPDNAEALNYYHDLIETRNEILAARSSEMPLTIYDNAGEHWDWVNTAWPWQPEAN